MTELKVETYCLGMWQTNSYIISGNKSRKCWIIDAGFEPEPMINDIKEQELVPELLIYTHAHLDHIAGTSAVRAAFPEIKTAVSVNEAAFLRDPVKNLSVSAGMSVTAEDADTELTDGEILYFEDLEFRVIFTPGHSPGGICLYQPASGLLFAGDTLFQGSIGRYDFPTSNGADLFNSINTKLMDLPDDTRVFPGHGGATTIGAERRNNPFINR